MELVVNRWRVLNASVSDDVAIKKVVSTINSIAPKINVSDALDYINSWTHLPWARVFFDILKKKGVEYAYVSNDKRDPKFYAIVEECSVKKTQELSEEYIKFLDSYSKIVEDPYFEFLVFGRDEIDYIAVDKGFSRFN